jgi:hypothetical protein
MINLGEHANTDSKNFRAKNNHDQESRLELLRSMQSIIY